MPGVKDPLGERDPEELEALRAAHHATARMASYCAGAFVLGARLLDGRRATTHWLLAPEFRAAIPGVRLEPEHLYVRDGDVFTSAGVMSATDLSLHLVARDLGQAHANDIARSW